MISEVAVGTPDINAILIGTLIARLKLAERRIAQHLRIDCARPKEELITLVSSVLPELALALSDTRMCVDMTDKIKRWHDTGVTASVLGQPGYPAILSTIADPPWVLWHRGTIPDAIVSAALHDLCAIAIVGSRDCDREGYDFALECGRNLAACGVVVISGLALGIDTAAHHGALEAAVECPTIAVLGGGLNRLYPAANRNLAQEIETRGGAVISQYEPDAPTFPSQFLDRNRVISGLAAATVVVQASARSGALATARYACESGREVMAVPGSVNNRRYAGNHRLIRDGAHLVTCAGDIIELLPQFATLANHQATRSPEFESEPISALQQQLVKFLGTDGAQHMDLIQARFSNLELPGALLDLELKGLVRRTPGNYLEVV